MHASSAISPTTFRPYDHSVDTAADESSGLAINDRVQNGSTQEETLNNNNTNSDVSLKSSPMQRALSSAQAVLMSSATIRHTDSGNSPLSTPPLHPHSSMAKPPSCRHSHHHFEYAAVDSSRAGSGSDSQGQRHGSVSVPSQCSGVDTALCEEDMMEDLTAMATRLEDGTDSPVYVELERDNVVLVLPMMEKMHATLMNTLHRIDKCLAVVVPLRQRARDFKQELFINGNSDASSLDSAGVVGLSSSSTNSRMETPREPAPLVLPPTTTSRRQEAQSNNNNNNNNNTRDDDDVVPLFSAARATAADEAVTLEEREHASTLCVRVAPAINIRGDITTAMALSGNLSLTPQNTPPPPAAVSCGGSPPSGLCLPPTTAEVADHHFDPSTAEALALGSSGPIIVGGDCDVIPQQDLNSSFDHCDDEDETVSNSYRHAAAGCEEDGRSPPQAPSLCSPLSPAELRDLARASAELARLYAERGARLRRVDKFFRENAAVHERWESNEERSACFSCHRPFSSLRRRHHCRRCGRLTCSDCSTYCGKKQDTSLGNTQSLVKTEYAARITARDSKGEPEIRCDTYTYPSSDSPSLRPRGVHGGVAAADMALSSLAASGRRVSNSTIGDDNNSNNNNNNNNTNIIINSDSDLNDPITLYEEERWSLSQQQQNPAAASAAAAAGPARPKRFDWVRLCGGCYSQCLRARKSDIFSRLRNANRCILDDGYYYFHVPLPQEWRSLVTVMNKPDLLRKHVELNSSWLLEQPVELTYIPATGARLTATVAKKTPQVLRTIGNMSAYAMRSTRHLLGSYLGGSCTSTPPQQGHESLGNSSSMSAGDCTSNTPNNNNNNNDHLTNSRSVTPPPPVPSDLCDVDVEEESTGSWPPTEDDAEEEAEADGGRHADETSDGVSDN